MDFDIAGETSVGGGQPLRALMPRGMPRNVTFFGGQKLWTPNPDGTMREFDPQDAIGIFSGTYVPNNNGSLAPIFYDQGGKKRAFFANTPMLGSWVPWQDYQRQEQADPEAPGPQTAQKLSLENAYNVLSEPNSPETQAMVDRLSRFGLLGNVMEWLDKYGAPALMAMDVWRGILAEGWKKTLEGSKLDLALPPALSVAAGWLEMTPEERGLALGRTWRGQSPGYQELLLSDILKIKDPRARSAAVIFNNIFGWAGNLILDPANLLSMGMTFGAKVSNSLARAELLKTGLRTASALIGEQGVRRVAAEIAPLFGRPGMYTELFAQRAPGAVGEFTQAMMEKVLPLVGNDQAKAMQVVNSWLSSASDSARSGFRVMDHLIALKREPLELRPTPTIERPRPEVPTPRSPQTAPEAVGGDLRPVEAPSGATVPPTAQIAPEAAAAPTEAQAAFGLSPQAAGSAPVIAPAAAAATLYPGADVIGRMYGLSPEDITARMQGRMANQAMEELGLQRITATLRRNREWIEGTDVRALISDPEAFAAQAPKTAADLPQLEHLYRPPGSETSIPHYRNPNTESLRGQVRDMAKQIDTMPANESEALFWYTETSGDAWNARQVLGNVGVGSTSPWTQESAIELLLKQTGEYKEGMDLVKLAADPAALKAAAPTAARIQETAVGVRKFYQSWMGQDNPLGVSLPEMTQYLYGVGDRQMTGVMSSAGAGRLPRLGGPSVSDTLAGPLSGSRSGVIPLDWLGETPGDVGRFGYHATYGRNIDELVDGVVQGIDPTFSTDVAGGMQRYAGEVNAIYDRYQYFRELIGDEAAGLRERTTSRAVAVADANGNPLGRDVVNLDTLKRTGTFPSWTPLAYLSGLS
jgi:hypothetical protein